MYTLPDLQFPAGSLEPYIDEQTMTIHHGKHHATYIKNLNDALAGLPDLADLPIEKLLADLDRIPEDVRTKVRNNGGGHANHSLFWQCLSPASPPPAGELAQAISTTFGSFEDFKTKFTATAVGRFGSGWAWLVKTEGHLDIIDTPNQDSPISSGHIPLLGLDVWEHAYYLKYQNRRTDYIAAWWNVVNWQFVQQQFEAAA